LSTLATSPVESLTAFRAAAAGVPMGEFAGRIFYLEHVVKSLPTLHVRTLFALGSPVNPPLARSSWTC
jgi:hypothetical protein